MTNNKEKCCENCASDMVSNGVSMCMNSSCPCHTKTQEDSFSKIQTLSRELQTEKHPRSLLVRILTELVDTERESAEKGQYVEGHHDGWKEGRQQAYAEVRQIATGMLKDCQNHSNHEAIECYGYDENYNSALTDLFTKLEEKK